MPLALINANPENITLDAIALAVDESMQKGGRAFNSIVYHSGNILKELLIKRGLNEVGQAKCIKLKELVSDEINRNYQSLIITVAPKWIDGHSREVESLANCYTNIMNIASQYGYKHIGIGLIDQDEYGVPQDIALETALQTISQHPAIDSLNVYLISSNECVIKRSIIAKSLGVQDYSALETAIKELKATAERYNSVLESKLVGMQIYCAVAPILQNRKISIHIGTDEIDISELKGESFSQMLLRKIDESGMKDSEVYKNAQVSKQLFSKIRSDIHYQPKKGTAISFSLALKLNLSDTEALLRAAGYVLTESRISDRIIITCLKNNVNDIFEINNYLYECGQPLLSS